MKQFANMREEKFVFFISLCVTLATASITNLSANPSFRSAILRWERKRDKSGDEANREDQQPDLFVIRVCENQPWGPHECSEFATEPRRLLKIEDDGVGGHEAFSYPLGGLRMATDYTVAVRDASIAGQRTARDFSQPGIVVSTQGCKLYMICYY